MDPVPVKSLDPVSVKLSVKRLFARGTAGNNANAIGKAFYPVAVVANSAYACREALQTACTLAGDGSLLLIAVGGRSLLVGYAASIGEVISESVIRQQCQTAAWDVAGAMLRSVPADIAARLVICERWRGRELRNCLVEHQCKTLVVGGQDISTSQRRRLDRLVRAISVDVVVV